MELSSWKVKRAGYIERAGWKINSKQTREQDVIREEDLQKWAGAKYDYISSRIQGVNANKATQGFHWHFDK